jgi:hypothetical protein
LLRDFLAEKLRKSIRQSANASVTVEAVLQRGGGQTMRSDIFLRCGEPGLTKPLDIGVTNPGKDR